MNLPGVYQIFLDKWKDFQTCYIISDTHFNDKELRKNLPDRPQDEDIVKSINKKVGKKDILILLGDVGDLTFAEKLRGYKILIAGNHDTGLTAYSKVFNEIYSGPLIIGEKLILSHEPVNIPWALNIHGHVHNSHHAKEEIDDHHLNACCDVINYTPISLNQLLKEGKTAHITPLHRTTINTATKRKKKRQKRISLT